MALMIFNPPLTYFQHRVTDGYQIRTSDSDQFCAELKYQLAVFNLIDLIQSMCLDQVQHCFAPMGR